MITRSMRPGGLVELQRHESLNLGAHTGLIASQRMALRAAAKLQLCPPVAASHHERVLSSKKRSLWIVSRWYQSANTSRPACRGGSRREQLQRGSELVCVPNVSKEPHNKHAPNPFIATAAGRTPTATAAACNRAYLGPPSPHPPPAWRFPAGPTAWQVRSTNTAVPPVPHVMQPTQRHAT